MQTTNKQLRDQLRLVHILASVVLGIFIYSPWQSNRTLALLMSVGIFPILTLTGLWMWQASQHQQVAQAGSYTIFLKM